MEVFCMKLLNNIGKEILNRAIVLEQAALKPWQQPVNVLPQPHAGGSFATTAWQNMKAPTA